VNRDVTYDEDRSQVDTGTAPQVMAAIRNAAVGVLRLAGVTNIAAANRYHARNANRPLAPTRHHQTTLPGSWVL
jgi:hypothetical protein